jgi:N-acetyl-anhydromuramyl-L-alanine amidase AmpD
MVVAPAPPYIPARWHGGKQTTIKRIVIHGTVSPTILGGARDVAHFFATEANQTSAHYVVDPGEVIQCVYDHTIAWHDGTNTNSIGVELCDPVDGKANRWQDRLHQDMLKRAANLVRDLCWFYSIPIIKLTPAAIRAGHAGICGHADMRDAFPGSTTHYDPGTAFPWNHFIDLVNQEDDDMPTAKEIAKAVCDEMDHRHPNLTVQGIAEYVLQKFTWKDWAGNTQHLRGTVENIDQRTAGMASDKS